MPPTRGISCLSLVLYGIRIGSEGLVIILISPLGLTDDIDGGGERSVAQVGSAPVALVGEGREGRVEGSHAGLTSCRQSGPLSSEVRGRQLSYAIKTQERQEMTPINNKRISTSKWLLC